MGVNDAERGECEQAAAEKAKRTDCCVHHGVPFGEARVLVFPRVY